MFSQRLFSRTSSRVNISKSSNVSGIDSVPIFRMLGRNLWPCILQSSIYIWLGSVAKNGVRAIPVVHGLVCQCLKDGVSCPTVSTLYILFTCDFQFSFHSASLYCNVDTDNASTTVRFSSVRFSSSCDQSMSCNTSY